jgi:hypothetical protein
LYLLTFQTIKVIRTKISELFVRFAVNPELQNDDIQIGKCEGCKQIIYDINNMNEDFKIKMKDYDIKSVPTTIIDSKIKMVEIPDFPWICSEDLYKSLEKDYPLETQ